MWYFSHALKGSLRNFAVMQQKSIYTPKDFQGLRYKVFETDDVTSIPGFQRFDLSEICLREDCLKLIRYAFVLYDKNSPLVKQHSNLIVRKMEAALAAGYDLEQNKELLNRLYDFQDIHLQHLVIEFLKDQNDLYWCLIVSNEQTFFEYQKALLGEVSLFTFDREKLAALQIKAKIMEDSDKIAERLEAYYTKVFGDGEVQQKAKATRFNPESQAKK
jgi:hypothetical protein